MKHILTLVILATTLVCYGQDNYLVDGNRIIVTKVLDNLNLSSDDIFKRVESYFTNMHGGSNFELLTCNKESGIVIGKDLYKSLVNVSSTNWDLEAFYTLRIDVKDNKVRIICSVFSMLGVNKALDANNKKAPEYIIAQHYPITDKSSSWTYKKTQKKAFNILIDRMNNSVEEFENIIRKGSSLSIENEDW